MKLWLRRYEYIQQFSGVPDWLMLVQKPQPFLRKIMIDAKQAAETVADYVNNMGHDPKEFVEQMARQHRTLQQSFTGVCLKWLEHLSKLKEGEFDLRNEDSVKVAQKLLKDIDPRYDLGLSYTRGVEA